MVFYTKNGLINSKCVKITKTGKISIGLTFLLQKLDISDNYKIIGNFNLIGTINEINVSDVVIGIGKIKKTVSANNDNDLIYEQIQGSDYSIIIISGISDNKQKLQPLIMVMHLFM